MFVFLTGVVLIDGGKPKLVRSRESLVVHRALGDKPNNVSDERYPWVDYRRLSWIDLESESVGNQHHKCCGKSAQSHHRWRDQRVHGLFEVRSPSSTK